MKKKIFLKYEYLKNEYLKKKVFLKKRTKRLHKWNNR